MAESMRAALAMDEAEVAAHLAGQRRVQWATTLPDGSIHLVPLDYLLWDGAVAIWTDPASQKVRNLRRDPRVTALVEAGASFEEYRGVQLRGRCELLDDAASSQRAGELLVSRAFGGAELPPEIKDYVAGLAADRVVCVVRPERVLSWDHRKVPGLRPDQVGR